MDSESPAVRQAFLRDSVKWLISKAFNNDVPDDIKEPFYKDHENQERLKPQIVVQLGNATLFCQTLSNLYSDPNCHNLNHWSILQILTRKGVLVAEASDIPITETVLIQTNPLIIKAHMSVIESLMNLYAREILCGDLVSNAIKRISGSSLQEQIGPDCEQSLFAWVSQVYVAIKRRIAKEADASTSDQYCVKIVMPDFPPLQDFLDVCDGMWLAVLISYYCPKILPWTQVRIKCYPTLEDSAHNASLVSIFSQEHLPNSVFQINELIQMRRSMKSHLIVFLADLFDFFEIHPQKCVSYRGILTDFDEPDTHFFASNTPGRVQLGYDTDSGSEKQDHETEKYLLGQQIRYLCPGKHQSSFEKDYDDRSVSHYLGSHNCSHNNFGPINEESKSLLDVSKLATIRMKLEEKHRRIEQNKNNIEVVITRHEDKSTNPELMQGISTSIDIMNTHLQDIQQDILKLAAHQTQIQLQFLKGRQQKLAHPPSDTLIQQFYGSQQHLAVHCQKNLSRRQPNFGSTPHLTQAFSSPNKEFISPSRDLHQQRVQPQPIQYINEHRQHIINQPMQQSPLMLSPTHFTLKPYNICKVNGAQVSCSRLIYGGGSHHYQLESPSHYQYNLQLPQQEFGNRFTEHDIFPSGKSHQPNEISINESTLQPLRRTWLNSLQHQNHPSSATIPITCQLTNFFPEAESPNACIKQPENSVFHQNGECNDYEQNKISEDIFQVHITPHYTKQQQQLSTNLKEHYSAAKNKPQVIETQAPIEDMAPQSICFIGDEDDVDEIERNIIESMKSTRLCGRNEYGIIRQQLPQDHNPCYFLENYESDFKPGKLNITSGSLTYRVPSPSRPLLNKSSFQDENKERLIDKKGFYISFDDDIPTRPKPPLRTKRLPRKKSFEDNANHKLNRESVSTPKRNLYENDCTKKERIDNENFEISKATYNKYTDPPIRFKFSGDYKDFSRKNYAPKCSDQRHLEGIVNDQASQSLTEHINLFPENRIYNELKGNVLVIGRDVSNLDPNSVDEMERRKEKIVLLSLQRRQQQEEAKARKEIEANERREREREKEEVRSRKKEEQIARRAVILEKHRLKKAIEEAEHEGKTHDRSEISINQQFQTVNSPRLRQQRVTRLRPKTIHIDTGSVEVSKTSSMCSHGKKGSSTNSTDETKLRGCPLSMQSIWWFRGDDRLVRRGKEGIVRFTLRLKGSTL